MNKENIISKAKQEDEIELIEFVKLAILEERAACAKIAKEWSKRPDDIGGYIYRNIIARGQV